MTLHIYLIIACIIGFLYFAAAIYGQLKYEYAYRGKIDISVFFAYGILVGLLWPFAIFLIIIVLIGWIIGWSINATIKHFNRKHDEIY